MTITTVDNEKLLAVLRNRLIPPSDRCDMLLYNVCEHGIDFKPAIEAIIREFDVGQELRERSEGLGEGPLTAERFLGAFRNSKEQFYAVVTRGHADVFLPAMPEDVEEFCVGDAVLVDVKQDRIAGRDGVAPVSGEIVAVETLPADRPGHIIVRHRDELQLARLHHDLAANPESCRPGGQVIYDPVTRFALGAVDTSSDGDELLVKPETLERVNRENIGSPKPVIREIVDRVKSYIDHIDWVQTMQVRNRCSYLFCGSTGGGKSYHLKLLANEIHDHVENLTGVRTSRLVLADASKFWTPYFGETEQKISRWIDKLAALGAQKLKTKDGREIVVPLLVGLEECDQLLRSRGGGDSSSHLFDRPLSLMLQKTESLECALQVPIIWVATSNRADLIDAAALRRMGMRKVLFGTLKGHEAHSVLKTKVPADMPVCGRDGAAGAREDLFRAVLGYLYGPEPGQPIAEVQFTNSKRRTLNRSDVVTPAILEEAVSFGVDRCLQKSRRAGRLLGLDAADVATFLDQHFVNLAYMLNEFNLAEHCPEWFANEPLTVSKVLPLVSRQRRLTSTF